MSTVPPPPGITTVYENASKNLDQQRDMIDKLDTKAAAMIGLLGVVIGGYIVGARTDLERWLGGAALVMAVLCLLYGFSIRGYANAPEPELFARYAGQPKEELEALFLGAVLHAYEWNTRRVQWKVRAINAALAVLTAFALVLIIVVALKLDPRV